MQTAREVFESNFEKFSSTTVIRVFNFIRISGFLVERLFWIAILLCFSFGTVWNVTNTIQTFLSEPTASRVSFLANSTPSNMSFPDTGLCLEMRSDILVKMYESKIDNVVEYIDREANFPALLKEKLAKVHKIEDQRSAKLANLTANASLSTDSIASVSAYHQFDESNANVFNSDEVALLALTTAMFFRLLQLESTSMVEAGRFHLTSTTAIQRLYKTYSMRGTNFNELLTLNAELMCVVLQIRLTRSTYGLYKAVSDHSGHNVCKYSNVVYFGVDPLGDEVICYHLADSTQSPMTFYSSFDEVILTLHMESLYRESSTALSQLVVDPGGKYAIRQQPPLFIELNEKQTVNFSLETVSTSANLRRSGCWEKTHPRSFQYQCTFWCSAVEARLFSCNCLSLYIPMVPRLGPLPVGLRSCALSVDEKLENFDDERCRSSYSSFISSSNCSLACYNRDCESFLFASTVQIDDPSLAYLNASTAVSLRLTKFVYQKIDEYLTMDAMALITSLGGNLSLYLGASFLALIHIVVFFIKLPFEVLCGRKETTKASDEIGLAASAGAPASSSLHLEETINVLVSEVSGLKEAIASIRQHVEDHDRRLLRFGSDDA